MASFMISKGAVCAVVFLYPLQLILSQSELAGYAHTYAINMNPFEGVACADDL